MRKLFFLICLAFLTTLIFAQEKLDMDALNKIRKEGLENSKVMETAMYLTDVSGPRLTASPGYMRAATWAKNKLNEWGLANAKLEPWGEFGKGWEQTKCYVAMTSPYYVPLIAMPRAWAGSTPGEGSIKGQIVLIKATDSAAVAKYAGTLKDKIVMTWSSAKLTPSFEPDGSRMADTTLDKMAKAEPRQPGQGPGGGQRNQGNNPNNPARCLEPIGGVCHDYIQCRQGAAWLGDKDGRSYDDAFLVEGSGHPRGKLSRPRHPLPR